MDAASEITLRNMARFVEVVVSGGVFFLGREKGFGDGGEATDMSIGQGGQDMLMNSRGGLGQRSK